VSVIEKHIALLSSDSLESVVRAYILETGLPKVLLKLLKDG
jgi:hypothetical protein